MALVLLFFIYAAGNMNQNFSIIPVTCISHQISLKKIFEGHGAK